MEKIELEIGKSQVFKDSWGNYFKIKRLQDGYMAYDDYSEIGPYENIYVCERTADTFICGTDEQFVFVYQTTVSGFEEVEYKDWTYDIKRRIREIRVKRELESLPNCKYLGDVVVYGLKHAPDHPFAKKDGYLRILWENSCRHIYETQDGQIFAVNPDKPKPLEECKTFDTFEELCLAVQANKKVEYKNFGKPFNRNLQALYNHFKEVRCFPDKTIHRILKKLKELVGLEEFRQLKYDVKMEVVSHNMFDTEELYEALKAVGDGNLREYISENGGISRTTNSIRRAGVVQLQEVMKTLPSYCKFKVINIEYNGQRFSVNYPENERVRNALASKKLYDWKSITRFEKDNPPKCREIIDLQEAKIEKYREEIYLTAEKDKVDQTKEVEEERKVEDPLLDMMELS